MVVEIITLYYHMSDKGVLFHHHHTHCAWDSSQLYQRISPLCIPLFIIHALLSTPTFFSTTKLQAAGTSSTLISSFLHNLFLTANHTSHRSYSDANRTAMAETHEVTTTPPQPQPNNDSHHHPPQAHPSSSSGHEATNTTNTNTPSSPFVRPADLLRPRISSVQRTQTQPKADRPIDRDERAGLVS